MRLNLNNKKSVPTHWYTNTLLFKKYLSDETHLNTISDKRKQYIYLMQYNIMVILRDKNIKKEV